MLKEKMADGQIERFDCADCPEKEFYKKYGEDSFLNDNCLKCIFNGGPGKGSSAKPRKRGKRLPQGVVEKEIVEYLLNQKSYVGMQEIKSHLMYNLGVSDQKTIKKHLDKLNADKYISYKPVSTDGLDRWSIINILQLKKIKNKFPEVKLNNKVVALDIVAEKSASTEGYLTYDRLQKILAASGTLFDKFFNQSREEILREARRLYFFDYDTEFNFADNRIEPKNYITVKMIILNLLLHCTKEDIILGSPMDSEEKNRWKLLGQIRFSSFFSPDARIKVTPEELRNILDKEEIVNYDKEDFDYLYENRNLSHVLRLIRERNLDKEEIVNYDKEDFDYLSENRSLSHVLGLMRERKIDLD